MNNQQKMKRFVMKFFLCTTRYLGVFEVADHESEVRNILKIRLSNMADAIKRPLYWLKNQQKMKRYTGVFEVADHKT